MNEPRAARPVPNLIRARSSGEWHGRPWFFLSIDGRVCPFSMYLLYGMSHDRWIVWVGAATPL